MSALKIILLAAFFQFQVYGTTTDDLLAKDNRPPTISVPMTKEEQAMLAESKKQIEETEARLSQLEHEKLVLEHSIAQAHKPAEKSNTQAFTCDTVDYVAKIVGGYIVYTLQFIQCNPV